MCFKLWNHNTLLQAGLVLVCRPVFFCNIYPSNVLCNEKYLSHSVTNVHIWFVCCLNNGNILKIFNMYLLMISLSTL